MSNSKSSPSNSPNRSNADYPSTPSSGERESFKNCTELRKVSSNGVSADHPAYAPKHDQD
ncbi:excalibur calcium-binding domain-containing protein [Fervidibacillus halotolerans]|uniref:Excalibur calcium-binding domain-containing protein n=1 Tax=Fervidibacillus halotolerans TaxID=2980027 RepID=A0A9E8RXT3_9BACI|nr:excalibur calcium-binding domain-containing protein [Fervidibacillus halotolerans]WAA11534.1 excalibur calcium-binding domain-containing protein [Fervidibacillus halotolerans]